MERLKGKGHSGEGSEIKGKGDYGGYRGYRGKGKSKAKEKMKLA